MISGIIAANVRRPDALYWGHVWHAYHLLIRPLALPHRPWALQLGQLHGTHVFHRSSIYDSDTKSSTVVCDKKLRHFLD